MRSCAPSLRAPRRLVWSALVTAPTCGASGATGEVVADRTRCARGSTSRLALCHSSRELKTKAWRREHEHRPQQHGGRTGEQATRAAPPASERRTVEIGDEARARGGVRRCYCGRKHCCSRAWCAHCRDPVCMLAAAVHAHALVGVRFQVSCRAAAWCVVQLSLTALLTLPAIARGREECSAGPLADADRRCGRSSWRQQARALTEEQRVHLALHGVELIERWRGRKELPVCSINSRRRGRGE
mmetsp:Transcript_52/g.179  ORF Transcript_52/g.179 Transcript_52/m.179 type:complete len:243 (-) Transcript_52:322-1050(-)